MISLCAVSGGDADNDLGSLQLIDDGIRRLEGSPLLFRPEFLAVNECKCFPPLRAS